VKNQLSFFILLVFFSIFAKGQSPIDTTQREFSKLKFGLATGGGALFYAGTLTGLYTVWYQDNHKTNFHWTNDNDGWMQIDKFGHAYTCYLFGKLGMQSMKWAGVSRNKSVIYGGSFGVLFMTSVEILDAHYLEWGASPMDMVANASGGLLLIGQELAFKKQIVTYKFSFHPTELQNYRPDILGDAPMEQLVEDYNGQTFWLSLNLRSVFRHQKYLPNWLNIAGGYGAYGMLGGKYNTTRDIDGNLLPPIDRYRSYYLSFDLDLEKIQTNNEFLKSVFFFLNLIKFPLPTVEFNELGQTKFHAFYF